jgi:serine protease Do
MSRGPLSRATLAAAALLLIAACPAWVQAGGAKQSKADRILAIYIPHHVADERFYFSGINAAFTPGKALSDAALAAGNTYFKSAALLDDQSDVDLVLVIHPQWKTAGPDATLTVKYKLIDGAGSVIFEGEKKDDIRTQKLLLQNAFFPVSLGLMKDILSDDDLLAKAAASMRAGAKASAIDSRLLVDREKPAKTGTGFFVNDRGQVMTAGHVVGDCPLIEVQTEGKTLSAKPAAHSVLLDLAVLDTGSASPHAIPLRSGHAFDLGEGVIDIGFPLSGVLASSPNVTRGNISSREALAGAIGQFQFSAPVQPGSSGGPVVSETGELLGIAVGTLALDGLVRQGVVPQNVNFALDARYAAGFMDRYKLRYVSVPRGGAPDAHAATEVALPAVVQVSCYQ